MFGQNLTFVIGKQDEIVGVANISFAAQVPLDEVIKAVEVHIGKKLRGQIANRNAFAALGRREQIVAGNIAAGEAIGDLWPAGSNSECSPVGCWLV